VVRHPTLLVLLVLCCTFTLLLACTNDYEDFSYVPEESTATTGGGPGPGPGPGGCNNDGDCDDAEQCVAGACSCEGGPQCGFGDTCCMVQGCVDLDDDADNCGDCGNECPMTMDCNNGFCVP
jgi:hypothetical protein